MVCLEKTNHNWHEILQDIQNKPLNNSIRSVLGRLGLATCVYNIWRERNLRLFQGSKRTVDEVIQNIKDDLRWKIMSLQVKRTSAVKRVFKIWDISDDCVNITNRVLRKGIMWNADG